MLGALIVPPFVALGLFAREVAANLLPLAAILLVSTIAAGLTTAWTYRLLSSGRR